MERTERFPTACITPGFETQFTSPLWSSRDSEQPVTHRAHFQERPDEQMLDYPSERVESESKTRFIDDGNNIVSFGKRWDSSSGLEQDTGHGLRNSREVSRSFDTFETEDRTLAPVSSEMNSTAGYVRSTYAGRYNPQSAALGHRDRSSAQPFPIGAPLNNAMRRVSLGEGTTRLPLERSGGKYNGVPIVRKSQRRQPLDGNGIGRGTQGGRERVLNVRGESGVVSVRGSRVSGYRRGSTWRGRDNPPHSTVDTSLESGLKRPRVAGGTWGREDEASNVWQEEAESRDGWEPTWEADRTNMTSSPSPRRMEKLQAGQVWLGHRPPISHVPVSSSPEVVLDNQLFGVHADEWGQQSGNTGTAAEEDDVGWGAGVNTLSRKKNRSMNLSKPTHHMEHTRGRSAKREEMAERERSRSPSVGQDRNPVTTTVSVAPARVQDEENTSWHENAPAPASVPPPVLNGVITVAQETVTLPPATHPSDIPTSGQGWPTLARSPTITPLLPGCTLPQSLDHPIRLNGGAVWLGHPSPASEVALPDGNNGVVDMVNAVRTETTLPAINPAGGLGSEVGDVHMREEILPGSEVNFMGHHKGGMRSSALVDPSTLVSSAPTLGNGRNFGSSSIEVNPDLGESRESVVVRCGGDAVEVDLPPPLPLAPPPLSQSVMSESRSDSVHLDRLTEVSAGSNEIDLGTNTSAPLVGPLTFTGGHSTRGTVVDVSTTNSVSLLRTPTSTGPSSSDSGLGNVLSNCVQHPTLASALVSPVQLRGRRSGGLKGDNRGGVNLPRKVKRVRLSELPPQVDEGRAAFSSDDEDRTTANGESKNHRGEGGGADIRGEWPHMFKYRAEEQTQRECVVCKEAYVRICTVCSKCIQCYRGGNKDCLPGPHWDEVRRRSPPLPEDVPKEKQEYPKTVTRNLEGVPRPEGGGGGRAMMNNHKVLAARMDRAIYMAFSTGDTDPLVGLLNAGVSPSFCRETGETCLHAAAYRGALGLAKDLIARGADPTVTDAQGYLPVDLAAMRRKDDVEAFLRSLSPPAHGAGGKERPQMRPHQSSVKNVEPGGPLTHQT
ncbi:unnamed protein product [Choristocarpus tenellus]